MKSEESRPENGSKIPNPTPLEFRNLTDYPPRIWTPKIPNPTPLEFSKVAPTAAPPPLRKITGYGPGGAQPRSRTKSKLWN